MLLHVITLHLRCCFWGFHNFSCPRGNALELSCIYLGHTAVAVTRLPQQNDCPALHVKVEAEPQQGAHPWWHFILVRAQLDHLVFRALVPVPLRLSVEHTTPCEAS